MKFQNLTQEEKEQLKSYVSSIKEIKKEIGMLLGKTGHKLRETGGNMSTNLVKQIENKKK